MAGHVFSWVLFPPCHAWAFFNPVQASSSTLYRVLFPPCTGFSFPPAHGSFSTLHWVLFPPCAGFFFHPVQGSLSTLRRVLFPPCAVFFSTLAGFFFHPVQCSFPPCAVFFCHPVQDSFSIFQPCHTRALSNPVQCSFSTLRGLHFHSREPRWGTTRQNPSCTVLYPHCAGFLFRLVCVFSRVLFPPCALFFCHPVQENFCIFPPCHTWALFNPAHGSFSTLCRVLFPPCAGIFSMFAPCHTWSF